MKKLNNKGMTLVELIVSFLIVSVAMLYFFQTLRTVQDIYKKANDETQKFIDVDYAYRIVDAKYKDLTNDGENLDDLNKDNIFDDIENIINIDVSTPTNTGICRVSDGIIALHFDFYNQDESKTYHRTLYEYTNKEIPSGIGSCTLNILSYSERNITPSSSIPNDPIDEDEESDDSTSSIGTTTSSNNAATTTSTTAKVLTTETTKKKSTTKNSAKTDIVCPTFTYSKDNKTFTANPASVYNSSKVYVKISMDEKKYLYNKWYWYADNGKGGFTKYSKSYEKNNHIVNISGEGNRVIRAQVFNTNTKKSKNCDSKTIKIDRTPPKCPTITASGTKADGTWYKTAVTLNIKPTSDTAKWEWYTNKKDGSWYLWTNNNTGSRNKSLGDDGARTRQGKIVVYDEAGNHKVCYTDKYKIDQTLAYVTGKLAHPTKNTGSWSEGTRTSSDHLHYSASYGGAWHGGNDISVSKGTNVYAMDGGKVIKADTTTNKCSSKSNCKSEGYVHFGKFVMLEHKIDSKIYYTVYGHLSSISVKVGDKIKQGTKVGESGNTGNSSGPHLHVGMSYNRYDNNGYPIYGKNVIAPYVYISGNKKGKSYVGDTGKNN